MRIFSLCLLLGLLVLPAKGQTIWSRPYEPNQIAVEAIAPDTPDEADGLTGATYFTGTLSLSDNVEVATELPMARYGLSSGGSTQSIGNPYVGLGFSSTIIPLLFELGARIPAAPSDDATRIGQSTDMGRIPAFRPDELSLTGLLNGRFTVGRFSTLRLRAGLGYASYPTSESSTQDRDRDWRMHYDAQLWRDGDRFLSGLSFTGRATLTNPGGTQHHAAVSVMGNWTRVQPGLLAGASLNDLVQDGDFVPFAGLTLSITYLR